MFRVFLMTIIIGLGLVNFSMVEAQTWTWLNSQSGTWNTPSNWTPGSVPISSSSTVLQFSGNNFLSSGFTSTNNIAGTFQLNELAMEIVSGSRMNLGFTAPSSGLQFVSNGGTGPYISMNGNGQLNLQMPIDLAADTTIRGSGLGRIQLGANAITGSGGLIVAVSPENFVSFGGNVSHTFTGGTTIQSGRVIFGVNSFGPNGTIVVNGGELINAAVNGVFNNNIVLNANMRYYTSIGVFDTQTVNGVISGSGDFVNLGLYPDSPTLGRQPISTVTFTNSNTYTGKTDLRRANLTLSGSNGALVNTSEIILSGTRLLLNNSTGANANRLRDAAPVTMHSGALELYSGTAGLIENIGNVAGTGFNSLHNSSTTSPASVLNASSFIRSIERSTWQFGGLNLGTGLPSSTNIKLGTNPLADLVGGGGSAGSINVSILPYAIGFSVSDPTNSSPQLVTYSLANGARTLQASEYQYSLIAMSNTVSDANVNSFGTFTLQYPTTVNSLIVNTNLQGQGVLKIASGVLLHNPNAGNQVEPTRADISLLGIDFGNKEGIITSWTNALDIRSVIQGSNGITLSAAVKPGKTSPMRLSGDNIFTGPVTVNRGRIEFTSSSNFGDASNPLILNGGGIVLAGADLTLTRNIVVGAGNDGALDPAHATFGTTYINATLTIAGPISGQGGVVIGPGQVRLANASNSYTGDTVVNGMLIFDQPSQLGSSSELILRNGTLRPLASMTLPSLSIYNVDNSSSPQSDSTIWNDLDVTLTNVRDYLPPNSLADVRLRKAGSGRLILQQPTQFRSRVEVADGTFVIKDNAVILAPFTVRDGATLEMDMRNNTDPSSRILTRVTLNGGTLRILGNAGASTSINVESLSFLGGMSSIQLIPSLGTNLTLFNNSDTFATPGSDIFFFSGTNLGAVGSTSSNLFLAGISNYFTSGTHIRYAFAYDGTRYGLAGYGATGVRLLGGADFVNNLSGALSTSNVSLSTVQSTAGQTINALELASGGGLSSGNLTIGSGDLIALPGNAGIQGTVRTSSGNSKLAIFTAGDLNVNGNFQPTDAIQLTVHKGGPGALVLNGTNNGVNSMVIHQGTFRLGVVNALPNTTGIFLGSGTTFDTNNFNVSLGNLHSEDNPNTSILVANAPSVQLGTGRLTLTTSSGTYHGHIRGTSGGVTIAGSSLSITGSLDYAGDTLIRFGGMSVRADQPLGGAFILGDATNTTLASLSLSPVELGGIRTFSRPIVSQPNASQVAQVGVSEAVSVESSISLAANRLTLLIPNSTRWEQNGVISGPGSLAITGTSPGTLVLTQANTYAGGTFFSSTTSPIVDVANDFALGTGAITLATGNTVANFMIRQGDRTLANDIVNAGSIQWSLLDNLTLTGNITSSSSFRIDGPGTLIVSGLVTGTTFGNTGGVLRMLNPNNTVTGYGVGVGLAEIGANGGITSGPLGIGNVSVGNVDGTSGLRAFGGNRQIANQLVVSYNFFFDGPFDLTLLGNATLNTSSTIAVYGAGKATFGGVVSRFPSFTNLGITKTGPGTLILASPTGNNYDGTTTVQQGVLVIDNLTGSATGSGPVVVQSSGTLAGRGIISGAATIQDGGTLLPGFSTGTITFNGSLTLSAASQLVFELGSVSDLVIVDGSLTLDGILFFTPVTGFDSQSAYVLIDYNGTLIDNGLNLGSPGPYQIVVDTVNTRVLLMSVPEPITTGLIIMASVASLGLIAYRIRRKRWLMQIEMDTIDDEISV